MALGLTYLVSSLSADIRTYVHGYLLHYAARDEAQGGRKKQKGRLLVGCLSTHSFFSSLCITKKRHNCTVIYLGRNNVIIPEAGEGHFSKVLEHDTHSPTVISKCPGDYENVTDLSRNQGRSRQMGDTKLDYGLNLYFKK